MLNTQPGSSQYDALDLPGIAEPAMAYCLKVNDLWESKADKPEKLSLPAT